MYANLEEEFGLARHAMAVYDRATKAVHEDDKFNMYNIYISRAAEFFGVTRTREIFDKAIETLPDKYLRDMCLKYAQLEKKLGEIDRARSVYSHASQFADPRTDTTFWKEWHEFEVRHGNEDTFREMLRLKRSVQAQYSNQLIIPKEEPKGTKRKADESTLSTPITLVKASETEPEPVKPEEAVEKLNKLAEDNPEEINLDLDKETESKDLEEKQIPSAVFGGLGEKLPTTSVATENPMGALARFRRKK